MCLFIIAYVTMSEKRGTPMQKLFFIYGVKYVVLRDAYILVITRSGGMW